jgi:hypothetical protein
MRVEGRRRSWEQRDRRERHGENAFIFDAEFTKCFGQVPREQWEGVIAICSGDIVRAAQYCGLEGVPVGARALWGRTSEDALGAYRAWQQQKASGKPIVRERAPRRQGRPSGGGRGARPSGPRG